MSTILDVDLETLNKHELGCFIADAEEICKDVKTKEDVQTIFNRVSFGGERILGNFNGAEVAIVPVEDLEILEAMDLDAFQVSENFR